MANKKISQLNSATLPLAGTEEIAIVQSGETKKITANNLKSDKLSNDISTYTPATTPLSGTEKALIHDGTDFKEVAVSEFGGGGGISKKTDNLFFQDAVGSTVKTISADQKNMHQSRFLANASPFGVLGLTFGNGITEVGGVINLPNFSDNSVAQITGNYIGQVKKVIFTYARNVAESGANTNVVIRVMAETKYNTDMQLICEHNLVSSTLVAFAEDKIELPILSHLNLSPYSNIKWCIRVNNATAQQFGIIRLNIITEEV